ncbi:MAG: hypothetical protein U0Q55_20085 [Vicinamibacterales bacterium]
MIPKLLELVLEADAELFLGLSQSLGRRAPLRDVGDEDRGGL